MNLTSELTTAAAVMSVATLTALGLSRGTITNLREQLVDERNENKSLKAAREERDHKILELTADLAAMTRVVTNEVHWVALESMATELLESLGDHREQARAHWAEELAQWVQTEGFLSQIRDKQQNGQTR